MGKPRKIEIDDYMPCNIYEEFIFPRCRLLEEIWPALLTKALVKLYSYKFGKSDYCNYEVGDHCFYYSLLGYLGEQDRLIQQSSGINNFNWYRML